VEGELRVTDYNKNKNSMFLEEYFWYFYVLDVSTWWHPSKYI